MEKHILVPKHTKLSKEEKEELLRKYNISTKQLPMILESDPAIKDLDAKPEDVIMMERMSKTAKKSNFYRVVING